MKLFLAAHRQVILVGLQPFIFGKWLGNPKSLSLCSWVFVSLCQYSLEVFLNLSGMIRLCWCHITWPYHHIQMKIKRFCSPSSWRDCSWFGWRGMDFPRRSGTRIRTEKTRLLSSLGIWSSCAVLCHKQPKCPYRQVERSNPWKEWIKLYI